MIRILPFIIFFLVLVSCGPRLHEGLIARRLATESVPSLGYNVHYPEGYGQKGKKFPLILWLHGSGERGNDNVSPLIHIVPYLASDIVQSDHPCVVVAPQCPTEDYWAPVNRFEWTIRDGGEVTPAMKAVISLMEKLLKDPHIDKNRVYVGGLSMGGFGTLDILHRKPEWFAAAVPICGGADFTKVERFKHIPLWIFHGAKDDVVNPDLSRNLVEKLKNLGNSPMYTEYPDGTHDIWNRAIREPGLMEWLFGQVKNKGKN